MGFFDLLKPKWRHSKSDVRKTAVNKLTDQSILADIAKNDTDSDVRKTAVNKLTDQSILADIAKNDTDSDVRKTAVYQLTDQSILADIAKNASDSDVRKTAVYQLTDQSILADIAKNASDSDVRKTALRMCITMDSILSPVFYWSGNNFVGGNRIWIDKIQKDHNSAISWFNAQNFVPLPTSMGEEVVANYCFDLAYRAQTSNILQEAWAGYHQAIRRFLSFNDEKMIAITCWRLGQVYGARKNLDLAQLFFLHSAHLTKKIGELKGYGWALAYLGLSCKDKGNVAMGKSFWIEALNVFRKVSPDDASKLEKLLQNVRESSPSPKDGSMGLVQPLSNEFDA